MLFQIIATGILAVFYGCYFGKMLLQRRQGIRTDQLGRGKQGHIRVIELSTKTVSILVLLGELLGIFFQRPTQPAFLCWIGVVLACLGTAVFVCSVYTLGDSWRAGVPREEKTALVTAGIYRFSRNPAFLGFDLVYLGLALMFFHWALLVLSLMAILLFHFQIVFVEEPFLRSAFGKAYLRYSQKVRRYLGGK